MSENDTPSYDDAPPDHAITEELEWGSLQATAAPGGARQPTVIELPDKPRSHWRRARRSPNPSGEPALRRRQGARAARAALVVAALAICAVGAVVVAVMSTPARPHRTKPPASVMACGASMQPRHKPPRERRSRRRASPPVARRAPTRAGSDSHPSSRAQPPEPTPAPSTPPPPARQAAGDGEAAGGPFSP